ncbi:MAG: ComEC/Rec2 family competence protein [Oribacterium sp.]|uniref:ComEC/Rec2 family competence protein n=1 Tax=Oribacterium sp. oral taxon 102 TaxID=671214 RepID=UPI001FAE40AC|nr:MBL fold metallo-hydrolase [Oribacterium sp. oral taxon 102]
MICKTGLLAILLPVLLAGSLTFPAAAEPGTETSYVESGQTLEQASRQGLREAASTPRAENPAGVSAPFMRSYDPAAGYTVIGRAGAVQTHTESIGLSDGASITMLKGTETGQQLCLVLSDGKGHLVIVDGGQKTNAGYLARYIKAHGGKVDAWLLTHPHSDHVGALAVMLEQQKSGGLSDYAGISMGEIYHSFAPMDFYQREEEAYRLPMIEEIYRDIADYDQTKVHYNAPAGTLLDIGGIHIEIMNQAYQFSVDSGNNSSIVYKITIGGKTLLVTGDLPYEAAEQLLRDRGAEALRADIVQMAHHGQHGGSPAFYQAVSPEYVLWPTHQALWAQVNDGFSEEQETYTIALTKHWIDGLSVRRNFVMAEGDWTLN